MFAGRLSYNAAMASFKFLQRYLSERTYAWNYQHAPRERRLSEEAEHGQVEEQGPLPVPPVPGTWDFCGLPVESPLGVAAGPLLNGAWCRHYSRLGCDVLTYKTVRSGVRECYPLPNLVPVDCGMLRGDEPFVEARSGEERPPEVDRASWAVSFGMPSQSPEVWRADVAETRRTLPPEQRLCVSVVGTVRPGWSMARLADDYAQCAAWAAESGADAVEFNLSCPNVDTCDGQLYQRPTDAAEVARRVREATPRRVPLVAKIGHLPGAEETWRLLDALAPWVTALSMTNSVAARVRDVSGAWLFDGQPRGICGAACREASLAQVGRFAEAIAASGASTRIVAVGGVSSLEHVRSYLDAGAHSVQLATALMLDPAAALRIREQWGKCGVPR